MPTTRERISRRLSLTMTSLAIFLQERAEAWPRRHPLAHGCDLSNTLTRKVSVHGGTWGLLLQEPEAVRCRWPERARWRKGKTHPHLGYSTHSPRPVERISPLHGGRHKGNWVAATVGVWVGSQPCLSAVPQEGEEIVACLELFTGFWRIRFSRAAAGETQPQAAGAAPI